MKTIKISAPNILISILIFCSIQNFFVLSPYISSSIRKDCLELKNLYEKQNAAGFVIQTIFVFEEFSSGIKIFNLWYILWANLFDFAFDFYHPKLRGMGFLFLDNSVFFEYKEENLFYKAPIASFYLCGIIYYYHFLKSKVKNE